MENWLLHKTRKIARNGFILWLTLFYCNVYSYTTILMFVMPYSHFMVKDSTDSDTQVEKKYHHVTITFLSPIIIMVDKSEAVTK